MFWTSIQQACFTSAVATIPSASLMLLHLFHSLHPGTLTPNFWVCLRQMQMEWACGLVELVSPCYSACQNVKTSFVEAVCQANTLATLDADMTLCGQVTNPTFPTLVKLLDGGYGSRVIAPGHTIIAINPSWGNSGEIGQFWERCLGSVQPKNDA
eukprot:1010537-Pelagomonas_calceolata.AAC.2